MIDKIIDTILEYYDINKDDLFSSEKTYEIAHARRIAMYFIGQRTNLSHGKIGVIFNRNRGNVQKIINRILISKNKYLKKQLAEIDYLIGS